MMTWINNPRTARPLLAGAAALLLVVVALGAFVAVRVSDGDGGARPAAAGEHADHDAAEHVYYCPMHPDQRSTDPGAHCPICGMALVEMPMNDAGEADDRPLPMLRLTGRAHALLDIQTLPAERRPVALDVVFVGRLAFDERAARDLVVRAESYIETLHADYTWRPVEQGEVIAELDSPAITAAARELLLVAGGDNARASTSLAAARSRLVRLGVDDDQIDAVLEAGEAPRTYELRSPVAGVVQQLDARRGEHLAEGQRIARIADLSSLWLELEAYESDLPWLRVGQRATFTLEAQPGRTFDATVAFIDPVVDERSRTARVRLNVGNAGGELKPGMFARGAVRASVEAVPGDEQALPPLIIPRSAPLITGRRAIVYVRLPDAERASFEARQVTLGPRVGEHYIVEEGLAEGEQVVTYGAFKLDSELQIRGRASMMARDELFTGEADRAPAAPAPSAPPVHDH
ncbi:MAG: efflux RND transporter periplasmic adaptor subunit [Phycisphaeraceae bacterium]